MPSPVRNARLRAPLYTPVQYSPDTTPVTKDIIFRLNVSRIQKDIKSGAQVLFLPGLVSETLTLAMIKYVITLNGTFVENQVHGSHTSSPVVSATEHIPDFIDFEESTLFWNHDFSFDETTGVPINLPELQIEYGEGNVTGNPEFRVYRGMILSMELSLTGGHEAGEFALQFGVLWSPTNPLLREWS